MTMPRRPVVPNDKTVVSNGITIGEVKARLRTLEANLTDEGAHVRANTVWLAVETIRLLQGLK